MLRAIIISIVFVGSGCSHDDHSHNNENNSHNENNHTHDFGSEDTSFDVGGDVISATTEARAYCECMLLTCHDPWHEKHGVDDVDAMADCIAENSVLPHLGSPQTTGNSIECRQHFCDISATDDTNCPDALGPGCTE